MLGTTRNLTATAALAVTMVASLALVQPASAAPGHSHRLNVHVGQRLFPAHLRPDYVGMPGYAGGPPGATPFTPVEFPNNGLRGKAHSGLLRQGGLLGTGLPLATGALNGVPIIDQLGL